jgi:RNA polymerase sigma-70 factor (ECF subfamily)
MAWVFTILRNHFYSQHRTKWREVEDVDGSYAHQMACAPEQEARLDYADLERALNKLAPEQREALLLVAAQGFAYEDAARICGVPEGTLKSRVSRGRARLAQLLSVEHPDDLGADRVTRAAMGSSAFH